MPALPNPPLGLQLARAAKTVSRSFDEALATADGSLSSWLVLLSLKTRRLGTQRELADAVGIRGATLTRHLDGMEANGLVRRRRDPANRRVSRVEITEAGEEAFYRMREAALTFDRRLRRGLSAEQSATLTALLDRLRHNAGDD